MQLQKFVGESTPAVLGSVKEALGSSAIILANRRVGDRIEIIATGQLDEESIDKAVSEQEALKSTDAKATEMNDSPAEGPIENVSNNAEQSSLENDMDISTQTPVQSSAVDDSPTPALVAMDNESKTPVQIATVNEAQTPQQRNTAYELRTSIRSFVASAAQAQVANATVIGAEEKNEINVDQRLRRLEVILWGQKNPIRSQHLQGLLKIGLGAELAVRLVERVVEYESLDDALRQSLSLLVSTLPVGTDNTLSENGITIVNGPPGSGTTTTLVKLATQKVLASGNQSVVLICADKKRIGVFEALQTYGQLLDIPVLHAHNTRELKNLIRAFSQKELILIDHTLPSSDGSIPIPNDGLAANCDLPTRNLLVLPATIQSTVAEQVVANYPISTTTRCVLTQLDRTARLGELFSVLIRHHLRTAYWSDNSQVQLPLQKATPSVLVAAAMAMAKKMNATVDEQFLMSLIQPSEQTIEMPNLSKQSEDLTYAAS